ncbi:adenylate/guanylate cyclase domain-containing protein [Rhodoferax aquaticus]|uniref:FHA domain-containing protein n=1 Tax=Rhodoferax aquaticus TaxID=2527691 RepID=A0A515ENX4_9BURK|nr:adenylate/guanylate cyclase domain-containing protein [Rhodoferax aquaticus]QDL54369.1 FHA domain-containing protein [Rhodoferax aquaticus]
MGTQVTVVFTDLHGSTAVYESLGNVRATQTVTDITHWISQQCVSHGGRVVKTLGDGVLAMFMDPQSAVRAVVELQRTHYKRVMAAPADARLPMRVGLASGEVELVDNDCYGDAVNVASRLCDLCGPHQIWANSASLTSLYESSGVSFRPLGAIGIRGRAEPCSVSQIEWRQEEFSDFLTVNGKVEDAFPSSGSDVLGREIELRCMEQCKRYRSFELPIYIGRVRAVEFRVDDPRVSRNHTRLDWRNGSIVLSDVSSYGSWVRFAGDTVSAVFLRRQECVLHGKGEIALGAPFSDLSAPVVSFSVL